MEFKTKCEQKLNETFAQIKMKDIKPSGNKPRIKRYEKVYINTNIHTNIVRKHNYNKVSYVLITDERAKYISKQLYDFLSETLPKDWILLCGARWAIEREVKERFHFNKIDK